MFCCADMRSGPGLDEKYVQMQMPGRAPLLVQQPPREELTIFDFQCLETGLREDQ